jgi:hypothetical protein
MKIMGLICLANRCYDYPHCTADCTNHFCIRSKNYKLINESIIFCEDSSFKTGLFNFDRRYIINKPFMFLLCPVDCISQSCGYVRNDKAKYDYLLNKLNEYLGNDIASVVISYAWSKYYIPGNIHRYLSNI